MLSERERITARGKLYGFACVSNNCFGKMMTKCLTWSFSVGCEQLEKDGLLLRDADLNRCKSVFITFKYHCMRRGK